MAEDFSDLRWRRLAATVLQGSLPLRRGQEVIIETWTHTLGMAETLVVEARRRGIQPFLIHTTERTFFESQRAARPANANRLGAIERAAFGSCNGYILIPEAPEDFARQAALPAAHRRAYGRRKEEYYEALARNKVPSVLLLAATVTRSSARHYGVNYHRWREESLAASAVRPQALRAAAKPIVKRLTLGRHISIRHANGTRMELGLMGCNPSVEVGSVDSRNLARGHVGTTVPGGVVLVALDERIAEGNFIANRPSRHPEGVIRGLRWNFQNGRLARYDASEGLSQFEATFGSAGRERDRPALLAIGLNPRVRDFPLAEDQERGVVTLYVGRNEDFGGRTRGRYRSFALLRGADLAVDDRPLLKGGRRV